MTASDTDISSLMSRPTSWLQFDTAGQVPGSQSTHAPLSSPSLSHVAEVQQDRGLTVPQPMLRSKTVPHLPSIVSGHANVGGDSPSFAFSAEKVQKMQEWALTFVVGTTSIAFSPMTLTFFRQFNLTLTMDRSCEQYTHQCTCPLQREKTCVSFMNAFSVKLTRFEARSPRSPIPYNLSRDPKFIRSGSGYTPSPQIHLRKTFAKNNVLSPWMDSYTVSRISIKRGVRRRSVATNR